jgi:hypothetical protein
MILLIDDIREFAHIPRNEYTLAKTVEVGLEVLKSEEKCSEVWLDHDMGFNSTIWPVVDYMVHRARSNSPLDIDTIFVHSANPYGARTMITALSQWYPKVYRNTVTNLFKAT